MAQASLNELLPMITEQIEAGGEVRFRPRGISMLPFLMEGRDEVVLIAPPPQLKKGDIPFYRRADGSFVLHRVVGIRESSYTMCGDNQYIRERGVLHDNVIALAKGVYRKGRYMSADSFTYKLWGFLWPKYMFLKGILIRIYHKLKRRNSR